MSYWGREAGVWPRQQHNNDPHQDKISGNPAVLCLAFGEHKSDSAPGGTDVPYKWFMKGVYAFSSTA